ncbi:MAG: glycosyltransferase family 39 protein [Novosphingobium sp.]
MSAARPIPEKTLGWALLALFLVLVATNWVGFIGSDDVTFARGAYGWIEQFPFVGGHGTIRYTLTVPMALSFLALGGRELAMVLPSLLYLLVFLWLAWRTTREAAGPGPALAALAALITLPLLVIQASIANVDAVELAFLFGSFALYWRCIEHGPTNLRLFLCGVLAGLAFLTRETGVFVAAFYAPLFLMGLGMPRWRYLVIPLGFLAVWAIEISYLWAMTGDPLYRFNISLHHDSTIDRSIDLAGNVIVNPLIDPLLVLLLNQEFMLLFFAAIPLSLWLCFGRGMAVRARRYARLIAWLGLSWFVCVGAAQHLLPLNPRYFTVTAAMACILTGMGLVELARRGPRLRLAALVLGMALLGSNAIGFLVENKDTMFGEKILASLARSEKGGIVTDPETRYRVDMLLKWERAQDHVEGRAPRPGELYLYNPARSTVPSSRIVPADMAAYAPGSGWQEVRKYNLPMPMPARLVQAVGLDRFVPGGVWRKLSQHHQPVTLYRTGSTPAAR